MRTMVLLLFLIVVVAALAACQHTRYTEAKSTTFLFHYGDAVATSDECGAAKLFVNKCGRQGIVVDYDDRKNYCYPQPTYLVKVFINQVPTTFSYCANELLLIEERPYGPADKVQR